MLDALTAWMLGADALWAAILLRVLASRSRRRWRIGPDEPDPPGSPRVALVLPARDEEAHVGPCVEAALAALPPGGRVYVLDDGSTDRTPDILAALARRHPDRLVVLRGGDGPLPDSWLGKPWACMRAARRALEDRPDWLLFVDADVRLHPRAVRAALGWAARREVDLLSGLGRVEMRTFWERVLQPAVIGMILAGNPLGRVNDPERRRGPPLANGQFLLFRRAAYEAIGGHEAVRGEVVDDVGLARAVEEAGGRYRLAFMDELFRVRMYDSLGALWEGWTKNLFAGMGRSWGMVALVVAFQLLAVLAPYALAPAGLALGARWGGPALAAALLQQALRAHLDRSFRQPLRWGLLHPLGQAMLVPLVLSSAVRTVRGTATWKGRTVAG